MATFVDTLQLRTPRAPVRDARPLRVAALVDLAWSPLAGGHVKCWERLGRAAEAFESDLDLSIFFAGPADSEQMLAPNVRRLLRRPVFSTARLPFLRHVPDDTDLAPYHARLARELAKFDVIHTTDGFFAFARTAMRVASRIGVPLVNSIHTDTPNYARVFTRRTLEALFGDGLMLRLLAGALQVPERVGRLMERRLVRHQSACSYALVSRPEDRGAAESSLPAHRVSMLRRGVDRQLFNPARRDRAWLRARCGVPEEATVVFFAGRMNRGKNVLTLASAVKSIVEAGIGVHLLCAGEGEDRGRVQDMLGRSVTCAGAVEEDVAARFFACADLFAQPSEIEIHANTVNEALAAGTAVATSRRSGMGRVFNGHAFGCEVDEGADAWAAALGALVSDPGGLRAKGIAARKWAEINLPSWEDVLGEDLLPVWEQAAREKSRVR